MGWEEVEVDVMSMRRRSSTSAELFRAKVMVEEDTIPTVKVEVELWEDMCLAYIIFANVKSRTSKFSDVL